jgi:very-short-patch-repair endonuclease
MDIEHGYQCDILVPVQKGISKKTIIECFGTYWHNYPYGRDIDIKRCTELREKGFRVLVFWENEIKLMNIFDFGIKLRC